MTGPLRMPDASGHKYAEDQRQQTVNPVMHSLLAGCMRACVLGNTNYQHSSLPDTMSCYACQPSFTGPTCPHGCTSCTQADCGVVGSQ